MKIAKYISIELYVLLLFIIFDLIQFLFIINTRIFIGDFFPDFVTVSNYVIINLFLVYMLFSFLTFIFYTNFLRRVKIINKKIFYDSKTSKFVDKFYFVLLILNFLVFVLILNKKAGAEYTPHKFTFLLNMFKLDVIFSLYYFLNRSSNKLYLLNVIGTVLVMIAQGWVGILFKVFIYELFFRFRNRINIFKIIPLTILIFVAAILAYSVIYPIKNAIRYGYESIFIFDPLPLSQAAFLIFGRLSMFSNLVAIYQYSDNFVNLLNSFFPPYFEILRFFRVITPSFIAIKLFPESINYGKGYILWSFHTNFSGEGVYGFGSTLMGTLYLLFNKDILEAVLYILAIFIIIIYLKCLLDLLNNKILYFLFFLNLLHFVRESGEIWLSFSNMVVSWTLFILVIIIYKNFRSLKVYQSIVKEMNKGK